MVRSVAICALIALVLVATCVSANQKIRNKRLHAAVHKGKRHHHNDIEELRFEALEQSEGFGEGEGSAGSLGSAAVGVPNLDCQIGAWTLATSCNASCGGGVQEFHLSIVRPASGTGTPCPPTIKYEACHTEVCPVDCSCTEWSVETPCSSSCGESGKTFVSRNCTTGNEHGRRCPPDSETRSCNRFPCPINCAYSPLEPADNCSAPCGGGRQKWQRKVITTAQHGGAPCIEAETVQEQDCNTHPCPVDCVMSAFVMDGTCSKDCNGGTQNLKREVLTPESHGGAPCGAPTATQPCNVFPCPIDCEVGPWDHHACNVTCGGGKMTSTRQVIKTPSIEPSPGRPCPPLAETVACNTHPCPQDCVVSSWVASTPCSKTCGGGEITYTRTVLTPKNAEGAECPTLEVTHPCNTDSCYHTAATR